MLDVIGQNYRENELLAAHAQNPKRKILGTENQHDRRAWLALRDNRVLAGKVAEDPRVPNGNPGHDRCRSPGPGRSSPRSGPR